MCSHIWHILLCIILWCNQQLEVMRVRRVIDRFFLIDKRGDRHKIPTAFFLTTSLFSFYQRRSAAETDPGVLDSGDTEEMDVQAVKGKSFISVDPLGQVDWSWAFWFGFYFAFFPPTDSTLLLQLLQTEKVMGLRFCPDKRVRTLSLLLTPLSHHWELEAVGEGGTEELSIKAYHPVLV